MATILEFRASFAQAVGRSRLLHERRSAEIVIFPGVRYERWGNADDKCDALVSTAKRDVLKLVE